MAAIAIVNIGGSNSGSGQTASPRRPGSFRGTSSRALVGGVEMRGLYTWGWGACGQLGLDSTQDHSLPAVVTALADKNVVAVAAGGAHTLALVESRDQTVRAVYSWGACSLGQTGHPHLQETALVTPRPLKQLKHVDFISCGSNFSTALTEDGKLYVWGSLLPKAAPLLLPEEVTSASLSGKAVRSVQCGGRHIVACVAGENWIHDSQTSNCMLCKILFTYRRRRHHCRNCGGIFCGPCSSKKMAVLKLGHIHPVRVCDSCFAKSKQ